MPTPRHGASALCVKQTPDAVLVAGGTRGNVRSFCMAMLARQGSHGGGGHFHRCTKGVLNQEWFFSPMMSKSSEFSWQVVVETPQKCLRSHAQTRQIVASALWLPHYPSYLTKPLLFASMVAFWHLVGVRCVIFCRLGCLGEVNELKTNLVENSYEQVWEHY